MQRDVNILYAIGLKPEDAVNYFQRKGFNISWDWSDTWKEAHAKAFTVAKVMKLDLLQKIKSSLDKALSEGYTFEQWRRTIQPDLINAGWWGKVNARDVPGVDAASLSDPGKMIQLGSMKRLKTIYRANIQTAYQAGRFKQQLDNAGNRPNWMYIQLQRPTKREDHAKLHGKVFRFNDPIWDIIYPPNGFFCACRVRALTDAQLQQKGLKLSKGSSVKYIPPDGWDYNPGKAAFYPDLDKYDYDVAVQYLTGGLTGSDFKYFFESSTQGNFPVAVINPDYQKSIQAKTKMVSLSKESLEKNKTNHPDISFNDYTKLPDIIAKAQTIVKDSNRTIVFFKIGQNIYYGAIKSTLSGKGLFLTSFRLANKTEIKRILKKGEILKNEL